MAEETTPTGLLAEMLKAERGDPESESPEEFLRYLQESRGGLAATLDGETVIVYQVSKVLLAAVVIDKVVNGRKVDELTICHPEGHPIPLYAHPTHIMPWGGALEERLGEHLLKIQRERE